jgi:hypothetical protein
MISAGASNGGRLSAAELPTLDDQYRNPPSVVAFYNASHVLMLRVAVCFEPCNTSSLPDTATRRSSVEMREDMSVLKAYRS